MDLSRLIRAVDIIEARDVAQNALNRWHIMSSRAYTAQLDSLDRKLRRYPSLRGDVRFLEKEPEVMDRVRAIRDAQYFSHSASERITNMNALASAGLLCETAQQLNAGYPLAGLLGAHGYRDKIQRRNFVQAAVLLGVAGGGLALAACGGGSKGSPISPTDYVEIINAPLEGLITKLLTKRKMQIQGGPTVDIRDGRYSISKDLKLMPGNYVVVISPEGNPQFYERQTTAKFTTSAASVVLGDIIGKDSQGRDVIKEVPLDVIETDNISGYRLADYAYLSIRDREGASVRWLRAPGFLVYDNSLWQRTDSGLMPAEGVPPQGSFDGLLSVLADEVNPLVANAFSRGYSVIRESETPNMPNPRTLIENSNSNPSYNIIYLLVVNQYPGVLVAIADDHILNGEMRFASAFGDVNRRAFDSRPVGGIETARMLGYDNKKGGLVTTELSGRTSDLTRNYVAPIFWNRKVGHQTPDRQA